MSDAAALYLVLVAIYGFECLAWLPNDAVAYRSLRGAFFRPTTTEKLFGNHRGGVLPLYPLPALGSVFMCRWTEFPFSDPGAALREARRRLRLWRRAVRSLRLLSSLLALFVFAVCPAVVLARGLVATWLILAVELVLLLGFTVCQFQYLHHRVFPRRTDERRSKLWTMVLSPLAAMRAVDALTLHLLDGVHPVVAALVLCDKGNAKAVARKWLVDSGLAEQAQWGDLPAEAFSEQVSSVEAALRRARLSVAEVLSRPPAEDESCHSYCPRCEAQYMLDTGSCGSCEGIRLRPLADLAKSAK